MRKFLLLLKTQFRTTTQFRKQDRAKGKKSSGQGYMVVMAVALIIVVAAITTAFIGMGFALAPAGLLYIIPTIAIAAGCAFCLFTSIYMTNGVLFCFKDYDLVMSLPIKTSTIVACRLVILYVYNLLFILALMVPALCVYAYFASPPASFYILYIIGMLLAPMLPTILATAIGALIAIAASHFQKKSYMSTILTLLFLVVWMLFVFNIDTVIENIESVGPRLTEIITSIYPPAQWFALGTCDLNAGMYLLFAGVSVGSFGAFCAVVGHFFRRINSSLSADRAKANYRMQTLRSSGIRKALLRKEFKRLTGSSTYFMNTCIGAIMAPVLAMLILISGGDVLGVLMETSEFVAPDSICLIVALFISFFIALVDTTASSISIEGKNFWIIRSLPVSGRDVLQAKLLMNFLIVLVSSVISAILLCVAMSPSFFTGLLIFLTPIIFGAFSTVFGQKLNLKFPSFDWTDETKVVKRDKPVTILSISFMPICFGCLFLSFFGGIWVAVAADAVLLVATLLIYRSLMTKGVVQFENLPVG